MKLSSILAGTAAAGLVAAAPIRIVVVTSHRVPLSEGPIPSAIRFGHPAAGHVPGAPAGLWDPNMALRTGVVIPPPMVKKVHHCGGFRSKVNKVSNVWRKMLGLDPVEESHSVPRAHFISAHGPIGTGHHNHNYEQANSLPFGSPPIWTMAGWNRVDDNLDGLPALGSHRLEKQGFAIRLQHALTVLGPWEGRAVSFVLGCGLGVLLRMLFVFTVILLRARKRTSEGAIALPAEPTTPTAADPAYDEKKEQQLVAQIKALTA